MSPAAKAALDQQILVQMEGVVAETTTALNAHLRWLDTAQPTIRMRTARQYYRTLVQSGIKQLRIERRMVALVRLGLEAERR